MSSTTTAPKGPEIATKLFTALLWAIALPMLRDVLGPEASRRLDGYLSHEFAPHIKMQPIAEPK
jgi:hypothetical protein